MNKNKKQIVRKDLVKKIKKQIKNGTYDVNAAVKSAAERIADYPQALLWR